MPRQVVSSGRRRDGTSAAPGTQDDYVQRLLKLIPAETVAMYLFLEGVTASGLAQEPSQLATWLWAIFGILLVGNVLYIWRVLEVNDPIQYVILSLAFIVWIFTIGGPFQSLAFYQPFMGSLALGLFTFFVPIIYKGTPG